MQAFEFHFNPKTKEDLIFDSFCYEPENVYERKMGSLYMLGILKNTLPQNFRFLDNLAQFIKERYYKQVSFSPEKSLRESLRKANQHLEKIAKEGDVSWLGNLNFSVMTVSNQKARRAELNFTKVGDLKILLIRGGEITDIDQKLKFEGIEPYPLKIFGNIVSGKLAENDIVLVLTKEVFDCFLKENVLSEIAKGPLFPLKEGQKKLKEIFNKRREQLSQIAGICLLVAVTKENLARERQTLAKLKIPKAFSFKEIFKPIIKGLKLPKPKLKLIGKISFASPMTKLKAKSPPKKLKISLKTPALAKNFFTGLVSQKTFLILVLILLLVAGFFIFKQQEAKELKSYQEKVILIQEKVNQAENYLILAKTNPRAEKNANSLFREAWEEILAIDKISAAFPSDFAKQVSILKNTISEKLFQLNKLADIPNPELFFEFKASEFIPQKIISFRENLYFFSPLSENLLIVGKDAKGQLVLTSQKFNSAVSLADSLLFFSKPDQLAGFKDNQPAGTFTLPPAYPEFNFVALASYNSNLYFLDNKTGNIVKYPYSKDLIWESPQLWLNPSAKKITAQKSMAVDGSVWILTKENIIEKYYAGNFQTSFNLDIFPAPESFSKIFTSGQLPYLYLLEPSQNRIVILDKTGKVVKQYQSEKFDALLDFTVSEDGKTIWLLNGLKIYKIGF